MKKKNKTNPTMVDVAKHAGVALGTVSKVMNGLPVGREYRDKVLQAVQELNYQINNSGRALRANKTDTVALVIPNAINPFFGKLAHYIVLALEKKNKNTLLCFTEYDRNRELELIRMAQQNRVDGIIALSYHPNLVIPEGIPFVSIDRFLGKNVPCVSADNFHGGYLAAQKLIELGCKSLAMIRIGTRLNNEPSKRKEGFLSACIEFNVPYEILSLEDGQDASLYQTFLEQHIKDNKLEFDGIFVGTDSLAYHVITLLEKLNIKVPENVQVIGFDGIQMFGNQNYIVSTIVQPVEEMAETLGNIILSKDLSSLPSLTCLPVHYAFGGTTIA